ncbi:MAG: right-handed parallel beta-helix repeat-containing protein, partial [Elusimicrobiota bacterium]|nr:right-handed parallel beta-helix repeat-containing protein [Elusimicrobiota bacterium]
KVTHLTQDTTDLVYLDWVGVSVTAQSVSKSVSLTTGGDISLSGNNSMIDIKSLTNNTTVYASVGGNITLAGEFSQVNIDVSTGAYDATIDFSCKDLKLTDAKAATVDIDISTRANVQLTARNITIGKACCFRTDISGDNVLTTLDVSGLGGGAITVNGELYTTITGTNSVVRQDISSKMTFNALAYGTWDCSAVYTSSIVVNLWSWTIYKNKPASINVDDILGGITAKNASLKFKGANPDPTNYTKPDSTTAIRNCRINSVVYIQEVTGEWRPGEMWRSAHTWFGGDVVLIGMGGKEDDKCSGTPGARVTIYNCDFEGYWDSLSLLSCSRINRHWYGQGISSSIARGAENAGILFNNTSKCDISYCQIYNNIGGNIGNIGYGILFQDSNENTIEKCNIYQNKIIGVYLKNSNKNLMFENTIHDQQTESGQEGIYLYNSAKNVIVRNECYNNPVHGIALEYGSNNNYIAANRCFNNSNGGMRVRYNANGNIFVMNTSTGNLRTGFTSHSSIDTLCAAEIFEKNSVGDIYIEGEENIGYISQVWLKDCLLGSPTEFTNTPEKQEFTKENSWVISQKHDRLTDGKTYIWGQFSMPQPAHTWHTADILKCNYSDQLYETKSHGWNTTLTTYDTAMLRYDDGGIDGPGMPPSGTHDITSITTSSTTKTELWMVKYDASINRWRVWGSSSGWQKSGGPNGDGLVVPDTDYTSDNGEIRFRITHRPPVSPGEDYVFVTIAESKDKDIQKQVNLCDFSDPKYIGASFENKSGATVEIVGISTAPTIITRKLAEDVPNPNFYYGLSLGGTINKIQFATFTYINANGLTLNTAPLENTTTIWILALQPGTTYATYITANNITHTFDNIYIDTINVTGVFGVTANNSTVYFRDYTRPFLPDKLTNSVVYWDPTIVWTAETGFSDDGVEPNSIERLASVEFRVKYFDRGLASKGNPPT